MLTVGQDPQLVNADLFNCFLLSAQQETSCVKCQEVPLDVFLMSGYKISLSIMTTERSDQVLEVWSEVNQKSCVFMLYSLPVHGITVLSLHEADRATESSTGIIYPYGSNSQCSVELSVYVMWGGPCGIDVSNYKLWYLGSTVFESWRINRKTWLKIFMAFFSSWQMLKSHIKWDHGNIILGPFWLFINILSFNVI